jgi:glucosylceramidase
MNCTTCTGVVTVDNSADTATYNAEYYVLGQASKFVKPGAVRIDSNTFGSGNLEDVAFRNPDGSDALIALNADTSSAHTFNVDENGQYFSYTLPAGAVATFTWTPGSTSTGGGSGISSSTWYQVVNSNSGDCVDDTNGGTANGTAVQQWACGSGNANQEWQFQPTSNGYYQVVSRTAPGLAWDVTGGTPATGNGVPIQLWSTTGATNQQWLPTLQSDGSYTFTARNSGSECLDVTNRSTANGTQLQQWSCTSGDTAQTFKLVPES